jgi:pimeloyl-ACP methyl ester carboxylesterase
VPAQSAAVAPTRMVWLPGAYHGARDFVAHGFPEAVRTRRLGVDLLFVDLELAHVGDRSAVQKLRDEVVSPARAEGVSVWFGGISLGGLIALSYAASYPDELDGLCLLAPYLGNRMLTGEIARAPGLEEWQPGELAETDEERRIWRYIKTRSAASRPLYLGYGKGDRFSAAHELLAATLPADAVDVVAGGHEWLTWVRLWENFLSSRFS